MSKTVKLVENVMKELSVLKINCTAQQIQLIHIVSLADIKLGERKAISNCLKNCLEAVKTIELLEIFIANYSSSLKSCIIFSKKVFEKCKKSCEKCSTIKVCKPTSNECLKQIKVVNKLLDQFKKII
tara:strand:+ start:8060 stop:8440 length:381 start_codon:yes stop_codon:yes gene_type:complete